MKTIVICLHEIKVFVPFRLALRMLPKRQHEEAVVVAGGWLGGCDAWVVAIAAVVVAVEEEEEEGGRSEVVWDWEEDGPSVFWE